jgi:low affinity Fe/Cu permease
MREGILLLIRLAPSFASKIISEYIYAYSTGLIDNIAPMDSKKLQSVISKQIVMERELIEAIIGLRPDQKELVRSFFKVIS